MTDPTLLARTRGELGTSFNALRGAIDSEFGLRWRGGPLTILALAFCTGFVLAGRRRANPHRPAVAGASESPRTPQSS